MSATENSNHQPNSHSEPSANGQAVAPPEGRDPKTGRFVKGWRGGPGGCPYARRLAKLRHAFMTAALHEGCLEKMVQGAMTRAIYDVAMMKVLLSYLLGKPAKPLDVLLEERELFGPDRQESGDLREVAHERA